MQSLALAPRRARQSAPAGAFRRRWPAAPLLALTLAALAPGCIVVERHYHHPVGGPVAGPVPAGAPDPSGAGTAAAPQESGEATVPAATVQPGGQYPSEGYRAAQRSEPEPSAAHYPGVAARDAAPQYPGPGGDYDSQRPRFAFTIDGSLEVDDRESLYGFGFYVVPAEYPVGFYMNTRFTAHTYGHPDFTDLFGTNAFGHEVVDEELHAFVLNFGLVAPLIDDSVHLFAGIGFAATETELELRDPAGIFGDNGEYYQRTDEDEDFNFNVGVLLLLDVLALNAQWDTALEVFSFGVGFAF